MANRYLIATGNWNNTAIWSASSGGSGGASVPGSGDVATSDVNAKYTVSLNNDITVQGINLYQCKLVTNNNDITVAHMGFSLGGADLGTSTVIVTHSLGTQGGSGVYGINGQFATIILNTQTSSSILLVTPNMNLGTVIVLGSGQVAFGGFTVGTLILKKDVSNTFGVSIRSGDALKVRRLILKSTATALSMTTSYGTTPVGVFSMLSSNQLVYAQKINSSLNITGLGQYYVDNTSTVTGTGWSTLPIPTIESLIDAFNSSSVDTSKWNASTTVGIFSGGAGISSIAGVRTGTLTSKNQYLAEGSSIKFRANPGLGSITAYFTNAENQYGISPRRNIPTIYAYISASDVKFYLYANGTYVSSTFTNSYTFFRMRESAGVIYLDGSPDGIAYTNITSVIAEDYGLDATQLISQPSFSFYTETKGTATIGDFNVEQEPTAVFSATPVSGTTPLQVQFTDQSNFTPTAWSWNFGDSTTSTTQNPLKTYNSPGTYTVSLTASNSSYTRSVTRTEYITVSPNVYTSGISGTLLLGGGLSRKLLAKRSISGSLILGGSVRAVVLRDVESIQDKRYLYKVYDEEGNYIETWHDVSSELTYTHEINTIGSTTQVELARNSDTVGVTTSPIQTESGQNLLGEDGFDLLATTESKNQIGSGSSVEYNNRVDITVFYGSVEPLLTEDNESLLTEDDEELLADIGAPNGRRIFTGFISEINSRYGSSETTLVQLTSYGWDLGQYPLTDATGKTTVSFNSFDPSNIAISAVDTFVADSAPYNTYTTRDINSIQSTGTVVSYTFRANTYEEVLNKTLELMPSNWYYRIGLGDNLVYYRERSATPNHLFYLGKHIKALDLRGSIINATNRVLFTGGGDPALYIDRSEAPADRTRRSLQVMSDNRVTVLESAEVISEGRIDEGNKRQYRTTIEILSKQYDIESIDVGQTVGFRNFGNEVDSLYMQIVGLSYTADSVQLQLETKPPTINKRLADISRNLTVTENRNVPDEPS